LRVPRPRYSWRIIEPPQIDPAALRRDRAGRAAEIRGNPPRHLSPGPQATIRGRLLQSLTERLSPGRIEQRRGARIPMPLIG
jgi:hypothetical protein